MNNCAELRQNCLPRAPFEISAASARANETHGSTTPARIAATWLATLSNNSSASAWRPARRAEAEAVEELDELR